MLFNLNYLTFTIIPITSDEHRPGNHEPGPGPSEPRLKIRRAWAWAYSENGEPGPEPRLNDSEFGPGPEKSGAIE